MKGSPTMRLDGELQSNVIHKLNEMRSEGDRARLVACADSELHAGTIWQLAITDGYYLT
jgi:hypothetical protein